MLETIPPVEAGPASDYRLADLRGRALAATAAHRRAYDSFAAAFKAARSPEEKSAAAANCLVSALAA